MPLGSNYFAQSHYMTTPIYYVNDRPHLGHLYTTVAGDILTRFYKLCGDRVYFVTGTDEHGAKVERAAKDQGVETQTYVDAMARAFENLINVAHVQADDFIRTTQKRHHTAAQALWKNLEDNGSIYLGEYSGWYAVRDEAYYDASELLDTPEGKKAPTGASVEWVQEDCYFFRLSQWQKPLLDFYHANPEAIGPESRRNEVLSFLNNGLRDLAVSRSKITWGIPIPGSKHVMYVWIDALTNYLTVLGYPDIKTAKFQSFWPTCTHLMGKDILRFHAIYWPALLMATGLTPPKRLFAHGWWMSEGEKMSKSIGNVIDPFALIRDYGVDRVRYFLFRHVRFGQDGDFSKELFHQRCDHELAHGLGNLAHRVLSFIATRLGGMFPQQAENSAMDTAAKDVLDWGREHFDMWRSLMDRQDIYAYMESIYSGIQKGNAYMAHLAPWTLIKSVGNGDIVAQQSMNNGLYALVALLRDLSLALWPVMPDTAESLWHQVGMPGTIAQYATEGKSLLGADFSKTDTKIESKREQGSDPKLDSGLSNNSKNLIEESCNQAIQERFSIDCDLNSLGHDHAHLDYSVQSIIPRDSVKHDTCLQNLTRLGLGQPLLAQKLPHPQPLFSKIST